MKNKCLAILGVCAAFFVPLKAELQSNGPTVVFVHIGAKLPEYLECAIKQARLFNDCPIVLIANQAPMELLKEILIKYDVVGIACESLEKTERHKEFVRKSTLDKKFRDGFWFFASERFFYLDDMMQQYQMENIIHLESDVMLYRDVRALLPVLQKHYPGLGVTFDTDKRCIPGIVFLRTPEISIGLTEMMTHLQGTDDMYAIGEFRECVGKELVKTLPIISAEYIQHVWVSSQYPKDFANLVDEFDSVFDAAYHGQYLGGEDPRNGSEGPGYINPHCVIRASFLKYTWEKDDLGRLIPFIEFHNRKFCINNLHIHCKRLWDFSSAR